MLTISFGGRQAKSAQTFDIERLVWDTCSSDNVASATSLNKCGIVALVPHSGTSLYSSGSLPNSSKGKRVDHHIRYLLKGWSVIIID